MPRDAVDLRRQTEVEDWLAAMRPHAVFVAAGTVGGILANHTRPVEFLYDNLMIAANIVEAARRIGVEKLMYLASACVYPRLARQPIAETELLAGPLEAMNGLFRDLGPAIVLVVHAAAQPSHDWVAREPYTDFAVNAQGTLNLLEATRRHASDAVFIFTSTNKVYGDVPNRLPLVERETRWEIEPGHPCENGIPEEMQIDRSLHSLFGVSKAAADLLVQEYGRYFGLFTACFRCGCVTGPGHAGTRLHGFLAFLLKCAVTGTPYTVVGYRGKQVWDQIHAADLVAAFDHFFRAPRRGDVYNNWGARGTATVRCSRPSPSASRSAAGPSAGPSTTSPGRGPRLVDQRRRQVPTALSRVATALRRAHDLRGHSRTQHGAMAGGGGWSRRLSAVQEAVSIVAPDYREAINISTGPGGTRAGGGAR